MIRLIYLLTADVPMSFLDVVAMVPFGAPRRYSRVLIGCCDMQLLVVGCPPAFGRTSFRRGGVEWLLCERLHTSRTSLSSDVAFGALHLQPVWRKWPGMVRVLR